ncbi:hypothetical protein N7540_004772 [Penicillium herquei]|nr:hypothetical protein N7540_004772 [Penicillium herquei]
MAPGVLAKCSKVAGNYQSIQMKQRIWGLKLNVDAKTELRLRARAKTGGTRRIVDGPMSSPSRTPSVRAWTYGRWALQTNWISDIACVFSRATNNKVNVLQLMRKGSSGSQYYEPFT